MALVLIAYAQIYFKGPLLLTVQTLVWEINYIQNVCKQAAKALLSLCIRAGSPEPSILNNAISTNILYLVQM